MQSCLNDVFTGITENEGIFEEKDSANYISLTKGKKRVLVLRTSSTAHTIQLVVKHCLKELPVRNLYS